MNAIQNYVWGLSKKQQYEETIIEITTNRNETFKWGEVTGTVQYYDWGNGIKNNSKSHRFANAGVHTIKIVGDITYFSFPFNDYNASLITKIVKVASSITSFSYTFIGCTNLTTIPSGLFDKNVNVTDFEGCFSRCTNLTTIPSTLFDKNVNVTSFKNCFSLCTNLTTIPSGLFDKNVNVTDFERCFSSCENLTTIPSTLFEKNVNVTSFKNCFNSCTNLNTVPSALFDKNVNVTDFGGCFIRCTKLTNRPKPHGLEMWQIAGTNSRPSFIHVGFMFSDCTAMPDYTSLPWSVK